MKARDPRWPGPNYRTVREGSALLVCQRCGTVVVYGSVDQHDDWHERNTEVSS